MNYTEYENILTNTRLRRYLASCRNDQDRAIKLYYENIRLSEALFAVISLFEVALRNAIDKHYTNTLGDVDWLLHASEDGGAFDIPACEDTKMNIRYAKMRIENGYSKGDLLSCCELGIWTYMFENVQYRVLGGNLLDIFPNRPLTVGKETFDNLYVLRELKKINRVRNRIAHHRPICFYEGRNQIHTGRVRYIYGHMLSILQWMGIDGHQLFAPVDHVIPACNRIDAI